MRTKLLGIFTVVGLLAYGAGSADACPCKDKNKDQAKAEVTKHNIPEAELTTSTFALDGMHCGACADKILDAVKQLKGVASVEVSFKDKRAVVKHSSKQLTPAQIESEVSKLGFKAKLAKK